MIPTTIAEFLNWLRPGGSVALTSIIPDGTTTTATFTDYAEAERWALKQNAAGRNMYFTPQPTRGPVENKPTKADIARVEFLFCDLDPFVGEDLDAERTRIRKLLNGNLHEKGYPAPSITVDSGNGYNALWRLAEPIDVDGDADKIADAERYTRELVNRLGGDKGTHNIDRLLRLPFTRNLPNKTKRERGRTPTDAKVYDCPADAPYPLSAFPAIAADTAPVRRKAPSATQERRPVPSGPYGVDELQAWATEHGKQLPDSALAALVHGERLTDDDGNRVYPSGSEATWAVCCGLARAGVPDELIVAAVLDKNNGGAAHVLRQKRAQDYAWAQVRKAHAEIEAEAETRADMLLLHPGSPLESARAYIERERPHLLHHNDDWLAYNVSAYAYVEDGTMRSDLYAFLERAFLPISKEDQQKGITSNPPYNPTSAKVSNVLDALKAAAHRARDSFVPPCWLDGDGPPPRELIAVRNGLLHLPTGELFDSTPRFFTRNALAFAYDAAAPTPARWLEFLASIWPDETDAVTLLQEVFGYLITPDTAQQKIFLMIGPTRSGKGTIARVLTELVGPPNISAPSLSSLGDTHGAESLLGKQLAILSDVRLDGKANHAAIAEWLLRISGEDAVTVPRKYKSAWEGRLSARFLLLSNMMPRFSDASPALANRFVPLLMTESFLGREDPDLTDKLLAELPGILNWSIEGWRRLRARGRFDLPQSARDAIQQLVELASPVATFIRERCEFDAEAATPKDDLFAEWKTWCEANNVLQGELNVFSRNLLAATSGRVASAKLRDDGERVRVFRGIQLKTPPAEPGQKTPPKQRHW